MFVTALSVIRINSIPQVVLKKNSLRGEKEQKPNQKNLDEYQLQLTQIIVIFILFTLMWVFKYLFISTISYKLPHLKNASNPNYCFINYLYFYKGEPLEPINRRNITRNSIVRLLVLLLIRKGLLRILNQLRRIARLLGESRDYTGTGYHDTARRDKEYGRSVSWAGVWS